MATRQRLRALCSFLGRSLRLRIHKRIVIPNPYVYPNDNHLDGVHLPPVQYTVPLLALPPELIREILRYLDFRDFTGYRPYFDTFRSCALVCSVFRPFAQEQLFCNIRYLPWWHSTAVSQQNLLQIITKAPRLLSYARRIEIRMCAGFWSKDPWADRRHEERTQLLRALATHATCLREVHISCYGDLERKIHPILEVWDAFTPVFKNARRLILTHTHLHSCDDFYWLLNLFPRIEHLDMASVTTQGDQSSATELRPTLHLRTLYYSLGEDNIDNWLTPIIDSSDMTTALLDSDTGRIGDLPQLVKIHGAHICHLQLTVPWHSLSVATDHVFPMLPCLEELNFILDASYTSSYTSISSLLLMDQILSFAELKAIFTSLGNSTNLRIVTLCCGDYGSRGSLAELVELAQMIFAHTHTASFSFGLELCRSAQYTSRDAVEPLRGVMSMGRRSLFVPWQDCVRWADRELHITEQFDAEALRRRSVGWVQITATIRIDGMYRRVHSIGAEMGAL